MSVLAEFILPAALATLMSGLGLSLSISDFRRVFKYPKTIISVTTSILVILPLFGYFIGKLFMLPTSLAIGLILVGACPGGMMSNLYTKWGLGDIALSVSLTAICSLFAIVSIPAMINILSALQAPDFLQQAVHLPLFDTAYRLILLTLGPITAGVYVNTRYPGFANKIREVISNGAGVVVIILSLYLAYLERELLVSALGQIFFPVIALSIVAILIAKVFSQIAGATKAERKAITMEHIVKQEGTGIYIAITLLHDSKVALPLLANSLVGPTLALTIILFSRMCRKS